MVRIGTVVMGASDVRRAAAFWKAALGYVERDPATDDDWVVLVPAEGPGVGLALGLSGTPVQEVPGSTSICTPRSRTPRWTG